MSYLSKRLLNEIFQQDKSLFENYKVKDSFDSIKNGATFDVFLSYSYPDKDYALKIYKLMIKAGYSVYIDINDKKLDRDDVDEETAKRIATIMNSSRSLVYVHTASAKVSKWCPWELGYMSGKTKFRCGIIPLIEDKEEFPRQEYLGLYPIVDYAKCADNGKMEFWVNKYGTTKYVILKGFIEGLDPYEHKK